MAHGVTVVGCGNMAGVHCRAFAQMAKRGELRLVAAVDLDPARAERFKAEYGFARTGTDLGAELQRDDFDIVLLCTHWVGRAELIQQCFDAGKHVLAEKPLTLNLDEMDAIFGAAARSGCKLRVGLMERFRPMFGKIRELVRAGEVGRPQVYSFMHHQQPLPESWSYSRRMLQGGVTPNVDCGIHKCDIVRFINDGAMPRSVYSVGQKIEADSPASNWAHSVFHMDDGSVITLEDCYSASTQGFIYMWLMGRGGRIHFEYCGSHLRVMKSSIEDVIMLWRRDPPGTQAFHLPQLIKPVEPQMRALLEEIDRDADLAWHHENVRITTEMVAASVLAEQEARVVGFPLSAEDRAKINKLFSNVAADVREVEACQGG